MFQNIYDYPLGENSSEPTLMYFCTETSNSIIITRTNSVDACYVDVSYDVELLYISTHTQLQDILSFMTLV